VKFDKSSLEHAAQSQGIFQRGDHAELAEFLIRDLSVDRGNVVSSEGQLYVYDPTRGVFERQEYEKILRLIKTYAGRAVCGQRTPLKVNVSTAEGAFKYACIETCQNSFFDEAPPGISFANGFLTIADGQTRLLPHSPANRSRHSLPFDYVPNLPHAKLDGFLLAMFGDDDDARQKIELIQEFAGACAFGMATQYQRCLYLYGPGGEGKGTLLKLLRATYPANSVVSVPPQLWGERFQISRLVGVLANFCDETPPTEIVAGERFKAIVTGDPTHVERKHEKPFEFQPRAGHIFSCNALPGTTDQTHGFWRRMMVIRFTRNMEKSPAHKVDAAKDVIDNELSAIAVWIAEGAARLQRNGRYTVPASSAAILEEWKRTSDTVALHVDERTTPIEKGTSVDTGTGATALYSGYRTWAADSGYRPVSSREFARRMAAIGLPSVKTKTGRYYPVRMNDLQAAA
jgi:P4 family phage/plasmid primase-like protien